MRKKIVLLIGSLIVGVSGYVFGTVYGYRAAVRDYVENGATTIEKVADTMYETKGFEELPDEIKDEIDKGETEGRGYQ